MIYDICIYIYIILIYIYINIYLSMFGIDCDIILDFCFPRDPIPASDMMVITILRR